MSPAGNTRVVCVYLSHELYCTEIVRPHGDDWSVMVVTWKYHDPMNKPSPGPPLFCLMLACRKGDIFTGFYDIVNSMCRFHSNGGEFS